MSGVLSRIEACIPALRRYAFALLRSQQDTDDLVQDTLLRALEKLHTRRDEAEVRPWLFAILHNSFVSQIRRGKVRLGTQMLDPAEEAALSRNGGQEDNLRCRDLLRALKCLPLEQRTVVLLVSVEDLSYAEVARVLGIPIGTVMSRLFRARERLREMTEGQATRNDGEVTRPCLRRVK